MKPDLARYPEAARRVDSNSNKTAESPGQKESMLLSSETVTATTISTVSAARHTLSSLWVLLGLGVASPILLPFGFLMLPFILGIVAYGYIVAIIVYLLTVQTEHPKAKNSVLPILPLHPYRVFKINAAFLITSSDYYSDHKDIHYVKTKPHLTLDIHCSETIGEGTPLRPVIIFIYGGAWSSGNKSMYIPLAETLQEAGYVVVVPNYSTFPKGKIGDMVYDIAHAIHWTYGGDSSQIHLMGHSAGAHLCALTVIHDMVAYIENGFPNENLKVPRLSNLPVLEDCLPQIQGLILLAGYLTSTPIFSTRVQPRLGLIIHRPA
ncbi:Alpha/Beta hydrolase protein [Chytridium lagenaria]|nr:Alpha/Beta hydrolase protein [Chytridium lagenaria]